MHTIGQISAFVIVGLFVVNLVLGLVHSLTPHRGNQDEALRAMVRQTPTQVVSSAAVDIGPAISGRVKFFGDQILLDVEVKRLVSTRKEVRLGLVVTPRPVEGYATLHMDRLAVDAVKTALVTADGMWLQVTDAHGVGLLYANEVVRMSPAYAMGAPRRVELVFPALPSSARSVLLLVRWAPGKSTMYPEGWRTDRIVEVNLPPLQ